MADFAAVSSLKRFANAYFGLKLIPKKADQSDTRILVGLDGGIKSSGLSGPNSGVIFRIIDAMPMSECVKKKNQDNSLNK